jgi:hypothetical protein
MHPGPLLTFCPHRHNFYWHRQRSQAFRPRAQCSFSFRVGEISPDPLLFLSYWIVGWPSWHACSISNRQVPVGKCDRDRNRPKPGGHQASFFILCSFSQRRLFDEPSCAHKRKYRACKVLLRNINTSTLPPLLRNAPYFASGPFSAGGRYRQVPCTLLLAFDSFPLPPSLSA